MIQEYKDYYTDSGHTIFFTLNNGKEYYWATKYENYLMVGDSFLIGIVDGCEEFQYIFNNHTYTEDQIIKVIKLKVFI